MTAPSSPPTLSAADALDVLVQLDAQLGEVDPDRRALVALTRDPGGAVALTEIALRDDGVLEAPDATVGIVVVTSEEVELDGDDDEVVTLRQLAAILPDGTEVGVVRIGDDPEPRAWSSAEGAEGLRPRDVTANTARRALGLPTVAVVPPPSDLLARAWLVAVTEDALSRFDTPVGPRDVTPEELSRHEDAAPLPGLVDDDEAAPSWEDLRRAAVAGQLHLGSFTVDPTHAAWLDDTGFAQVLDRTLPPNGELLNTLRIVGEDPLVDWAISHLSERGWELP
ncbi:hypothetical protein FTX61_05030 [Nitriliruptoraceae bacterium ZYF776]|nr:hypothetical protein [Profundirhabdus halotolerans]